MKRVILLLFILCIQSYMYADELINVIPLSNNMPVKLEISAYFSFGSSSDCPELAFTDSFGIGNTLKLRLYYDITGPWHANQCYQIDTVDLGVLQAVYKKIEIEMYTVFYNTSPPNDTYYHPDPWTVFLPLSVSSTNSSVNEISIYPNPNNGRFIYSSPTLANEKATSYDVLNSIGQVLHEGAVVPVNRAIKQEVDMSNAPPGVYLLRIYTDKGILRKRFSIEQ